MNILKVNRGKVEIYKSNGSYVRAIGKGNAVFADFNTDQTLVAITCDNGKVEIYKENGSYVRMVGKMMLYKQDGMGKKSQSNGKRND